MRDSKWCFQHHKKLSNNNIIHTSPFVQFQPIVFSQYIPSPTTCKYRNKFGEYVCKNEKFCNKFCQEHAEKFAIFSATLRKLLNLTKYYKDNNYTIDSFFKLMTNVCFFFLKHKDLIVSFDLSKLLETLINMVDNNIMSFSHQIFTTQLIVHHKSKPFDIIIRVLLGLRDQLMDIRPQIQIYRARDILVSNNIKVNKLTEICLKQDEKNVPVFSKGIDTHILKFIV
jgi:hypothetical protein